MRLFIRCLSAAAILSLIAMPAPLRADEGSSGYKVLKTVKLGGEGGWDYLSVDSANHRLYISRGDRVMVVDTETDALVGTVPKTPGVHIMAVVPEHHRGFSSNGGSDSATVVDLKTLKATEQVKVGKRPDAAIYDPGSGRVFTFNAGSKDATAIDAESCKVVGSVKLDGKPEFAAADGKGMVFVNIEDKNEIVAFDSKELKVKAHWPVAPGEEPGGLDIDRENRRLFCSCGNAKMVVVDCDSGKVVATLDIGKGTDACTFDPETHCAFSSNRDGTLTVVKQEGPDTYKVVENVKTQTGARTMALDPSTHRIYLVTAKQKPAPTEQPKGDAPKGKGGRRRPSFEPNSFTLIVVGK